jgi:hypothetical protein
MNIKLISKNNMGIIAMLILIILLSQSRFFNFLTETPLGRMFLLAVIILIAYTDKIFGLLAVLFIIIAFNQNNGNIVRSYNFYEGFDNVKNITNDEKSKTENEKNDIKAKADAMKNDITTQNKKTSDSSQTDTTPPSNIVSNAREGFCMSDRELNIIRGKQSNTIPILNKGSEQNNGVDPSDKSIFSNLYASF